MLKGEADADGQSPAAAPSVIVAADYYLPISRSHSLSPRRGARFISARFLADDIRICPGRVDYFPTP